MFATMIRSRRFLSARLLGVVLLISVSAAVPSSASPNGDRLTYLDGNDPFSVGRDFPKLTTPQWIGEPDVQAVVILAIDDLNQPEKWERFLRPILERLKQIDGRAPVSIMTVATDPQQPQPHALLLVLAPLENKGQAAKTCAGYW